MYIHIRSICNIPFAKPEVNSKAIVKMYHVLTHK